MINASRSDEQSVPAAAGADQDLTPERILAGIAELASDRKALEIVALDLRGMIGYADYLLICSGRSDRQVKAIHDGIHAGLKQRQRLLPRRVEGLTEGRWVLLDYLDVVVHVFTPETREHYRLEQLWGEAPVVELGLVAV
jgi:ribosome-associated protein